MKQFSIIKKKEFIVWGILFVIVAMIFIGMKFMQKQGDLVVISVGNEVIQTLSLEQEQIVQIEGENENWVKLQIKDGSADVIEASCPDQICVNHYAISKEGEPIVCLPAKIVIQIEGKTNEAK